MVVLFSKRYPAAPTAGRRTGALLSTMPGDVQRTDEVPCSLSSVSSGSKHAPNNVIEEKAKLCACLKRKAAFRTFQKKSLSKMELPSKS